MNISCNYSLKYLNTFGIDVKANFFAEIHNMEDLQEILKTPEYKNNENLILGGGSNILFTKDFEGLVIKNKIKGIEIVQSNEDQVVIKAGAGENWHEFVMYCVDNNLAGIENLSLIPGTVGASPMQNIGAYGVEIKDVFECLEGVDCNTGDIRKFRFKDCNFGYRTSIFKTLLRNKFIITSVSYRLSKKPKLNITYGAIAATLENMGIRNPTIKDVSDAVCFIRKSKLPDPSEIGNAGSFFKNPETGIDLLDKIKYDFPDVVFYPTMPGKVKIPAGWLIEKCGWKGKRKGNAGVHKNQALVLVNHGNATGAEIKELAEDVSESVYQTFNIKLEKEVNIY